MNRPRCLILVLGLAFLSCEGCGREGIQPREIPSALQELTLLQIQTQDTAVFPVHPYSESRNAPLVLIFTRNDCRISNRYAPEVRQIVNEFVPRQVRFWIVYPDPSLTPDRIREHMREFDYPCPGLWDPDHHLAKAVGARVTPEVAVYDQSRRLVYCGRIDDRYVDFGKSRPNPAQHDLRDVLNALVSGSELTFRSEEAIGCLISDLRP